MKKNKPKKSLARRISNWVFGILVGLIFVGVFAVQIQGLATRDQNFGVTNYFGTQFLVVQTDSMVLSEPEDVKGYNVGTAVIVKKVDPSTIKVNDDLTFFYQEIGMVMTHRCSAIMTPSETGDGLYHFETHGINKHSNQGSGDMTTQKQYFSEEFLLGKVVGDSEPLGAFMTFSVSIWGLLTLLLIPTVYLIISSCIDIYKAYSQKDEEESSLTGAEASVSSGSNLISTLSKEDKERLKAEMLEEMLKKKKGEEK